MILTSDEIKSALTPNPPLIENHGDPVDDFLEGGAYDLRVRGVHKIDGMEAYIGVEERSTPTLWNISPAIEHGVWKLSPFRSYLVQTVENVNIPPSLRGMVSPRTTIFRSGWVLVVGPVHPGYRGSLTFMLYGVAQTTLWLEPDARIASIVFARMTGDEPHLYDGVWQGGRVGTDGKRERGY